MNDIIKKTLELENQEYYEKHLQVINAVLPEQMTPKEIEVLASFMALEGEMAEEDRFGTYCRKKVKSLKNLSNGGLANYIRILKEKGFIKVGESGEYEIPFFLFPQPTAQQYEFKIVNKEK